MLLRILCRLFGHRAPITEAEAYRIRAETDRLLARNRREIADRPNRG